MLSEFPLNPYDCFQTNDQRAVGTLPSLCLPVPAAFAFMLCCLPLIHLKALQHNMKLVFKLFLALAVLVALVSGLQQEQRSLLGRRATVEAAKQEMQQTAAGLFGCSGCAKSQKRGCMSTTCDGNYCCQYAVGHKCCKSGRSCC